MHIDMKKSVILLIVSILLLTGCSTLRATDDDFPECSEMEPFYVTVSNIDVSVDYVNDITIASQIKTLIETQLAQQESEEYERKLFLDISIVQRGFIQNVEQKNSIFVLFTIKDETGNALFRLNKYMSGSATIISATDQYFYLTPMAKSLIKYQKKVLEIYKKNNEIQD